MVHYSGSKRSRLVSSIANRSNVYGIMGGTISSVNASRWATIAYRTNGASLNNRIPLEPAAGLAYMRANNLLSVNPQASGGVGKRVLLYYS